MRGVRDGFAAARLSQDDAAEIISLPIRKGAQHERELRREIARPGRAYGFLRLLLTASALAGRWRQPGEARELRRGLAEPTTTGRTLWPRAGAKIAHVCAARP